VKRVTQKPIPGIVPTVWELLPMGRNFSDVQGARTFTIVPRIVRYLTGTVIRNIVNAIKTILISNLKSMSEG
jgi:hypothetical protein